MAEVIAPFYIPAPAGNGLMGIAKIRPQQGMTGGKIKLYVASGGPVFLFEADLDSTAVYDRTHGINGKDVDFDLVASSSEPSEIKKETMDNMITLASDVESIGYVQFKE